MEKIAKIAVKTPTRDAEATRNSILDAAEQEFAKVGPWGASAESVAARTGVTKAMIHYYFENKENLDRAVMERVIARRSAEMDSLHVTDLSPKEAVAAIMRNVLMHAAEHPNVASLIVLEALQNEGKYYCETSLGSLYGPLIESLKRGMECGDFTQSDPLHVAANLVGMSIFYTIARDNLKNLWPDGTDLLSPDMLEEHCNITLRMCLASLGAK